MKIISNDLEPIIETWSDPGDYPSGAGGGPLPSYNYLAGCEGEIVLEFDPEDFIEIMNEEVCGDGPIDTMPKIYVKKWDTPILSLVDGKLRVRLSVAECDADPIEPEPDYDDIGD